MPRALSPSNVSRGEGVVWTLGERLGVVFQLRKTDKKVSFRDHCLVLAVD